MKSTRFTPDWDTIIIGGDAAGLSAALLLGRSRRKTLVIDSHTPRNRFAQDMHGALGHEGSSPADLLSTGRREASSYGVHLASGHIQHVENIPNGLRVQLTHGETHEARTLIVASGVTDRLPDIPGP
ncbi:FAD-dependent oxidoreductase [Timonella sp. A28]|uniref:FAD-dependent oxidoreductase n=1 Tax=Timonella sp. A28 TaxID=3442640 RepID=UPI003EB8EDA6